MNLCNIKWFRLKQKAIKALTLTQNYFYMDEIRFRNGCRFCVDRVWEDFQFLMEDGIWKAYEVNGKTLDFYVDDRRFFFHFKFIKGSFFKPIFWNGNVIRILLFLKLGGLIVFDLVACVWLFYFWFLDILIYFLIFDRMDWLIFFFLHFRLFFI